MTINSPLHHIACHHADLSLADIISHWRDKCGVFPRYWMTQLSGNQDSIYLDAIG